jgi:hypothetical protein
MKEHNSLLWKDPKESLPTGSHLPWSVWKTLNRLRTETGRTASNMEKWEMRMRWGDHLFICPLLPIKCRKEDFLTHEISDNAIQVVAYWEAKGIWRPIRQEEWINFNKLLKKKKMIFDVFSFLYFVIIHSTPYFFFTSLSLSTSL